MLHRTDFYVRLGGVTLLASAAATSIDVLIARIATPLVHAPADYPSFTWLPLLAGCLMGAIGGYTSYVLLLRWTSRPRLTFVILAAGVLVASYALPVLPIINPEPRFAGVNWGIAFTLMGMHMLTAALIVGGILLSSMLYCTPAG